MTLEDLTGLKTKNMKRGRSKSQKVRKSNKKLGSWSYHELQKFVEYKAEALGKEVIYVKPHYTSQCCSKCGYIDENNRNGHSFKCTSCGFELDADLNASRNIATISRSVSGRLFVNQPNVASVEAEGGNTIEAEGSYKPTTLVVGS